MKKPFEVFVANAMPCAFCNCEEIVVVTKEHYDKFHLKTLSMECAGCRVKYVSKIDSYEGAFEELLEKWNRRTNDGTQDDDEG